MQAVWPVTHNHLSSMLHPQVRIFGHLLSPFRLWATIGVFEGMALMLIMEHYLGLPLWVTGALFLTSAATFTLTALLRTLISGTQHLTAYHQQIAILAASAWFLAVAGQPILPFLDVLSLALGLVLVNGRIGCLTAGCCFGRPHTWGVCYNEEYLDFGFPAHYAGRPLLPVQLIESALLVSLTGINLRAALLGAAPGAVLAAYLTGYSLIRFALEFLRGDAQRTYRFGFSEAQWTALILISLVVGSSFLEILPFAAWRLAVLCAVYLTFIFVAAVRRWWLRYDYRILQATHLDEMAAIASQIIENERIRLQLQPDTARPVPLDSIHQILMGQTSLGVQISGQIIAQSAEQIYYYGISSRDGDMSPNNAQVIAEFMRLVRHPTLPAELWNRHWGVYHLLVYEPHTSQGDAP